MTILCPETCNPTLGHVEGCPRHKDAPPDLNAAPRIASTVECPPQCNPDTGHIETCGRYVDPDSGRYVER